MLSGVFRYLSLQCLHMRVSNYRRLDRFLKKNVHGYQKNHQISTVLANTSWILQLVMHFRRTWCRRQMETFSALLAICAGNSPVTGEFPAQRPATRSFDVFFDRRMDKQLSKQSWGWWFDTPSGSLWRHCIEWTVMQKVFPWHCTTSSYKINVYSVG